MITQNAADFAVALAAADLFVIIVRYRELNILIKAKKQRTGREQLEVDRGLLRSVALEFFVFAPISVVLMWVTMRPVLLRNVALLSFQQTAPVSFDAWLGICSYGFPFVMVRRLVTRIALNTLREFAKIAPEEEQDPGESPHRGAKREGKVSA